MANAVQSVGKARYGSGVLPMLLTLGLAAGVKIYKGVMVGRDYQGYARPMGSIPGLVCEGVATSEVDNTAGAAGTFSVNVDTGVFEFANSTGSALGITDVGQICYAEDDSTVRKGDNGGTLYIAGVVVAVTALGVRVCFSRPPSGRIIERKLVIGEADLTAAATSQILPVGPVLPANARFLGGELAGFTAFSGGGAGSAALIVGGTDDDGLIASTSVFTGATGFPKFATAGAQVTAGRMAQMGGEQINARITSDVNVAGLTAGAIIIRLFFVDAA